MEIVLSSEEYRKFDQEIKELVYSCFSRGDIIIFANNKAKTVANLVCNFIINKFIKDDSEKKAAYQALIVPITHLIRKELHIGDWLLDRKPYLISAIYGTIIGYLRTGGIIRIYYPPD
jgi:hypothetical protein